MSNGYRLYNNDSQIIKITPCFPSLLFTDNTFRRPIYYCTLKEHRGHVWKRKKRKRKTVMVKHEKIKSKQ